MEYKPFDLEAALAGEPVMLLNNNPPLKVYLSRSKLRDDGIIFEFEDENRTVLRHSEKWLKGFGATNIVMWQKPRTRVQLDLPAPLETVQKGQEVYYLELGNQFSQISSFNFNEDNPCAFQLYKNGGLFATKEDAEEWLEALKGARR